MPRKYTRIQDHEKEILELREQGMTLREIGETLGFSYKTIREWSTRYKCTGSRNCSKTEGKAQENTTKLRMSA